MDKVLDLPGGFYLVADGDCSPWIVDGFGSKYRPHEMGDRARAFLGPLEDAERRRRKAGAPTRVLMAIVNARTMFERIVNGPPKEPELGAA